MDERPRKTGLISAGSVLAVIIVFFAVYLFSGDPFGTKAIDSAEKFVNQQVYTALGLPCERFDSECIYKDGDIRLICVYFYFEDSSTPIGSYCVYCVDGYAYNSTSMMGPSYDFRDSLPELRALFGI